MHTDVGIRLVPALMQALMSKVEADEQFRNLAGLEQLTYSELRLAIEMVADRLVQGIVPPEPLTNAQACGLTVPSSQAEQR